MGHCEYSDSIVLRYSIIVVPCIPDTDVDVVSLLGNTVKNSHLCCLFLQYELKVFGSFGIGHKIEADMACLREIPSVAYLPQLTYFNHLSYRKIVVIWVNKSNIDLVQHQLHLHIVLEDLNVSQRSHELKIFCTIYCKRVAFHPVPVDGDRNGPI